MEGYLIFVISQDEYESIFLPKKSPGKNFNFNDLEKRKGWLIRGQNTALMYKAKEDSKKYPIEIPVLSVKDSTWSYFPETLGVIAVKLIYKEYSSGPIPKESGTPFIYTKENHLINYIDEWNIAIEDIKYIGR